MKILKNKSLFRKLFWLWLITIIILTAIPIPWLPDAKIATKSGFELRLDYFAHGGLFLLMFVFYYFWKLYLTPKIDIKHFVIFIFGSLIFSYLDEYIQTFIPSRSYNIVDFYYNASGIVFGLFVYWCIICFRKRRENS